MMDGLFQIYEAYFVLIYFISLLVCRNAPNYSFTFASELHASHIQLSI